MTMSDHDLFIHPSALVETHDIGPNTRIWAFSHVMKGAVLGAGCNVGGHTFIESGARIGNSVTIKNHVLIWDGVVIEDDAFIGPAVVFTNDLHPRSPRMASEAVRRRYAEPSRWRTMTTVSRGASLGAGSVIVAGVTIGAYAMIGAGSVVTVDVAPHALVRGNPARHAGWACQCGGLLPQADSNPRCLACGSAYELSAKGLQPSARG